MSLPDCFCSVIEGKHYLCAHCAAKLKKENELLGEENKILTDALNGVFGEETQIDDVWELATVAFREVGKLRGEEGGA